MRDLDENDVMFNMGEGCRLHGDEFMQDCGVCGTEFCRKCHPHPSICPDCQAAEPDEEDFAPEKLPYGEDEDEVDRLLREADSLPIDDAEDNEADR